MPTNQVLIANKIRGVAAEHRFTQQRIADTLGISRASVVGRMQGRVAFSGVEIMTLARAMNVPVSRFFPEASVAAERVA